MHAEPGHHEVESGSDTLLTVRHIGRLREGLQIPPADRATEVSFDAADIGKLLRCLEAARDRMTDLRRTAEAFEDTSRRPRTLKAV